MILRDFQKQFSLCLRELQPVHFFEKQVSEEQVPTFESRFAIYRQGFFLRIEDALAHNFPRFKKSLSKNEFSKLVNDYIKAYPSSYWSIDEVGRELPLFISRSKSGINKPYLCDLATLDWKCLLSSVSIPVKSQLQPGIIAESVIDKIFLQHAQGTFLMESDWKIQKEMPVQGKTRLCIFRSPMGVETLKMARNAYWILESIQDGISVEKLSESLCGLKIAPEEIKNNIPVWISKGIIQVLLRD